MADDSTKKPDVFDLAGERISYISLEEARVLAIEYARDNNDQAFVWQVNNQEEGDDFYEISLEFRPAGRFRGRSGVEQFVIDKVGTIRIHQVLDEPGRRWGPPKIRTSLPKIWIPPLGTLILQSAIWAKSQKKLWLGLAGAVLAVFATFVPAWLLAQWVMAVIPG